MNRVLVNIENERSISLNSKEKGFHLKTFFFITALQTILNLLRAECQSVRTTPLHVNEHNQTTRFVAVLKYPAYKIIYFNEDYINFLISQHSLYWERYCVSRAIEKALLWTYRVSLVSACGDF